MTRSILDHQWNQFNIYLSIRTFVPVISVTLIAGSSELGLQAIFTSWKCKTATVNNKTQRPSHITALETLELSLVACRVSRHSAIPTDIMNDIRPAERDNGMVSLWKTFPPTGHPLSPLRQLLVRVLMFSWNDQMLLHLAGVRKTRKF